MEACRNASSTSDLGRREVEAAQIAGLEQQIQDLSRNMKEMAQHNQELSRRLMEWMKHQSPGREETQETMRLGSDVEDEFQREK